MFLEDGFQRFITCIFESEGIDAGCQSNPATLYLAGHYGKIEV
jgi:hypothetical protein